MQPAAPSPPSPPDLPKPTGTRDNGATAERRPAGHAGRAFDVQEPEEGSHPMAQTNRPIVPAPPQSPESEHVHEHEREREHDREPVLGPLYGPPNESFAETALDGTFRPRVVPDLDADLPDF